MKLNFALLICVVGVALTGCQSKSVERKFKTNGTGSGDGSDGKNALGLSVEILNPADGFMMNRANQGAWIVSGNCSENGESVQIIWNNTVLGQAACQAGNFSIPLNTLAVTEGAMTIQAKHSSADGRSATDDVQGMKDTLPPVVVIDSSTWGPSPTRFATLRNAAFGGADVKMVKSYWIHGNSCLNADFSTLNEFQVNNLMGFTLQEGDNIICAIGRDDAGNWQDVPTASPVIRLDTIAPVVTIATPVGGTKINSQTSSSVTVSGTCTENGRPVSVSASGQTGSAQGTATCTNNTYTLPMNFTPLSDGTIVIKALQTDEAGNEGSVTSNVIKDATGPSITIATPGNNFVIGAANETSFPVSGACSENGQPVVVKMQGSSTVTKSTTCNSGSYSTTLNLANLNPGNVTLSATHSDVAGNSATVTKSGAKSQPVCNPFGGDEPLPSDNGLVAYMAYLNGSIPNPLTLGAFWLDDVTAANAPEIVRPRNDGRVDIFTSKLDWPNQKFDRGFTPVNGGAPIVIPGTSTVLTENFSMHFRTRLILANKPAGNYYLAAIADDGVVVKAKINGQWKIINMSNTVHAETMICPDKNSYINLQASSDIPLQVTYFQGPRMHIALQLVWKKLSSTSNLTNPVDALCGQGSFYNSDTVPSTPLANWNTLKSRGWEVVPAANFKLPQDIIDRCP